MTLTYIDTDGGKLAVEVRGNSGPLIVCSPGMGDTRDAYGPLADKLAAAGYRVAMVDLRGHGDSTADFNRYGDVPTAEDYITVIKKLGGGPAVLAGASMSGAASVIAAGEEPNLVAGLVLLGPFLRNGAGKLLIAVMKFCLWQPWGPPFWRFYAGTLWPGLGDKAKERAASTVKLLTRPGRWGAFQATVAGANHDVVAPYLKGPGGIKTPALVVIGDKDPDWSKPVEEAKWVASNFETAELLTVPGVGHAPHFEKPDVVYESMIEFLRRIRFTG